MQPSGARDAVTHGSAAAAWIDLLVSDDDWVRREFEEIVAGGATLNRRHRRRNVAHADPDGPDRAPSAPGRTDRGQTLRVRRRGPASAGLR